ncbi:sigma-54-dependent Fis family transcriptional regulator, partial [Candidatus Fermentibacterales bacterium]|nr:sigma-54-dependent Fis family transcriptional regulator [Candidatus Fermentibacterales bacterium]
EDEGFDVHPVATGTSALKALDSEERLDLVVSDVCLPGADGMDILRKALERHPPVPVILMTAYGTIEQAVEAMKLGARDFIAKPFELDELIGLARRHAGTGDRPGKAGMVGSSESFLQAVERARKGAGTDLNLLIMGESGTGKELLARFVHDSSSRSDGPFVPVNCAAIPRELLESELFGAEKGAYTGSGERRPGRFEIAEGGTVFLDEIGDMEPALQGKILRVLQEKELTRVGGTQTRKCDVRIVSASNRDLDRETREGSFRQDLYYRLSEFPVRLPPLRERLADIPMLVEHFLALAGFSGMSVDGETMKVFMSYGWPGNIRELRSIILRAAALCGGRGTISSCHIEIPPGPSGGQDAAPEEGDGLLEAGSRAAMEREREMILRALEECGGNRTEAARLLRISYRTLLYRMKKLEIRSRWKSDRKGS